jgi:hypothetical protein
VVDGLEFCGLNEEANFYSPKALRFPVELEVVLDAEGRRQKVRLLKDDGHPYYSHEVAISHTQRLHLHLRQCSPGTDSTRTFILSLLPTAHGASRCPITCEASVCGLMSISSMCAPLEP